MAEYNRTKFVDRPIAPSLPFDELRAKTAEAYASLVKMGEDFDASATELVESQSAAKAGIVKALAQSEERMAEVEAESNARVNDIGVQAQLAYIAARQEVERAFEVAQVAAEATQRSTVATVARLIAQADRTFNDTEGQLAAGKEAAEQEAAFLTAKKDQILVYRSEQYEAAQQTRHYLLLTPASEAAFAGLFYDQMGEFALDQVQNTLRGIETVAAFVPGYGTLISVAAGSASGAISWYREGWQSGLFEIGLSVVPYAGGKIWKVVSASGGRVGANLLRGGGAGFGAGGWYKTPLGTANNAVRAAYLAEASSPLFKIKLFLHNLLTPGSRWITPKMIQERIFQAAFGQGGYSVIPLGSLGKELPVGMAVKETTQLLLGGATKRTLMNSQFFAHELIHVSQMMKNPAIARALPARLLHEPIQLITAHGEVTWPIIGGYCFGVYAYIHDWDF